MKTVLILCVLATVTRSAESAHQRLDSINDLKEVDFGGSVPKHSLLLLYWFANYINIDDNEITLNFDPNTDFGSHHYGNFEGLLEPGYRYYTIGNLNYDFPEYVRDPSDRQYQGGNLDRIIVGAERQHERLYRIHRVYLTQHIQGTTRYDPDHTYQISTNLLQQIRRFSTGTSASLWTLRQQFHSNVNDNQLSAFRQTWGIQLVSLGLFLFIVIQERFSRPKPDPDYRTQVAYRPPGQAGSRIQGSSRVPEPAHYPNYSPHRGRNDHDVISGECMCWFLVIILIILIIILISPFWLNGRYKK